MKNAIIYFLIGICLPISIVNAQTKDELVEYNTYILQVKADLEAKIELREKTRKELADTDSLLSGAGGYIDSLQKELKYDTDRLHQAQNVLFTQTQKFDQNEKAIHTKELDNKTRKNRIEIAQEETNLIDVKISGLKRQLGTDNDELAMYDGRLKESERKLKELTNDIQSLEQSIEVKKRAINSATLDLEQINTNLQKEKENLSSKKSQVDHLNAEVTTKEAEMEALDKKLLEANNKTESNKKSIAKWNTELATNEKQLAAIVQKITNNNKKIQTDTTLSVAQKQALIADNKQQETTKNTKQSEVDKLKSDINQITNENAVLSKNIENYKLDKSLHRETLTNIRKQAKQVDEEHIRLKNKIDALEKEFADKGANKEKLAVEESHLTARIEKAKNDKTQTSSEINEYKQKITDIKATIKTSEAEVAKLEVEKAKLKKEITQNEKIIAVNSDNIKTLTAENDELSPRISTSKALVADIEKNQKIHETELASLQSEIISKTSYKTRLTQQLNDLRVQNENEILAGIEYSLKGEPEKVLIEFEKATQKSPEEKTGHALLGYTQLIQNNKTDALTNFNKAITIDPTYVLPFMMRAQLNEESKNYTASIKDYDLVIYVDSTNTKALSNRGRLYHDYLNEKNKGCIDWKKALELGDFKTGKLYDDNCVQIKLDNNTYSITQLTKIATSETYAFTPENPVKVGKGKKNEQENMEAYLALIRDPNGKKIQFHKVGSCCPYNTPNGLAGKGILTKYQINYKDKEGKKTSSMIYITYFDYETPMVPKGMKTNHEIY